MFKLVFLHCVGFLDFTSRHLEFPGKPGYFLSIAFRLDRVVGQAGIFFSNIKKMHSIVDFSFDFN